MTSGAEENGVAVWSPDGLSVAFTTAGEGGPEATMGNAFIVKAHRTDGDVVRLPPTPPTDSRSVPNS